MALTWPTPGTRIKFNDKDGVKEGIVNGEPRNYDPDNPDLITHLPVHIPETDQNMMVYAKNIVTW